MEHRETPLVWGEERQVRGVPGLLPPVLRKQCRRGRHPGDGMPGRLAKQGHLPREAGDRAEAWDQGAAIAGVDR